MLDLSMEFCCISTYFMWSGVACGNAADKALRKPINVSQTVNKKMLKRLYASSSCALVNVENFPKRISTWFLFPSFDMGFRCRFWTVMRTKKTRLDLREAIIVYIYKWHTFPLWNYLSKQIWNIYNSRYISSHYLWRSFRWAKHMWLENSLIVMGCEQLHLFSLYLLNVPHRITAELSVKI